MLTARAPRDARLLPFVDCIWTTNFALPHRLERILPTGHLQLLISLSEPELLDYGPDGRIENRTRGAALQGARVRPVVVDTRAQRRACGVSFRPGGAVPFFGQRVAELNEAMTPLGLLWGAAGRVLPERLLDAPGPDAQLDLLERVLLEQIDEERRPSPAFELACRMLSEGARVDAVAQRTGVSPRALIEQFRHGTGWTPKLFARVERFQRVVRSMQRATSWAELAVAQGFADQAHMIREFQSFAGCSPTRYHARSADACNHSVWDGG